MLRIVPNRIQFLLVFFPVDIYTCIHIILEIEKYKDIFPSLVLWYQSKSKTQTLVLDLILALI